MMKKLLTLLVFALTVSTMSGCASMSMLPNTSTEAEQKTLAEGDTGWASYREISRFSDTTSDELIEAAKYGLGYSKFALTKVDKINGVVFGEHGMTLHDWNIIAAVYIIDKKDWFKVIVAAEGSKDIGFSGDATGGGWTGQILIGMREYLDKYRIKPIQ
ncbi:hypothetical protein [uncultured Pseudodesulfovibrio sp.]|uniref:hypothetical protein n=1 Tax=uncultured Pseudodesulfovibrio sp. TaxID=2035858 RepID=UPI0029C93CA9|nr:hypothetical protein [uncultured Pseudodesulfovibrio sp.]